MKNEEFQQKNTQNVERQEEESWAPWKWSLGLVSCSSLLEPPQMGFFFDHFSLRDLLIFWDRCECFGVPFYIFN